MIYLSNSVLPSGHPPGGVRTHFHCIMPTNNCRPIRAKTQRKKVVSISTSESILIDFNSVLTMAFSPATKKTRTYQQDTKCIVVTDQVPGSHATWVTDFCHTRRPSDEAATTVTLRHRRFWESFRKFWQEPQSVPVNSNFVSIQRIILLKETCNWITHWITGLQLQSLKDRQRNKAVHSCGNLTLAWTYL